MFGIFSMTAATAELAHDNTYAGQHLRDIKALSADDVDGLLSGRGMGFAKAAELNGYPGPLHVLELADELALSAEQRARTDDLFRSMQTEAKALGRALVDAELELNALFASARATPERLSASLDRIASVQAKLRGVHLEAHLEQLRILTPAQNARYAKLRGYGAGGAHSERGMRHGH
jgi:Spy/CpxP family protein refolding chaperone